MNNESTSTAADNPVDSADTRSPYELARDELDQALGELVDEETTAERVGALEDAAAHFRDAADQFLADLSDAAAVTAGENSPAPSPQDGPQAPAATESDYDPAAAGTDATAPPTAAEGDAVALPVEDPSPIPVLDAPAPAGPS